MWDQIIIDAIRHHRTLTFVYHGEHRTVEPHTFGRDTKGHKALSAYQINKGWRLFHLMEMMGLQAGGGFHGTRPEYVRGDSRMEQIFAEL